MKKINVHIQYVMDQITIKTPNPKCHLYWCLIEFIDWRYCQSQSVMLVFSTILWTSAPLTFSRVVWRAYQGAAAISVESLGRCCEPGNDNTVGNFALICCPGGWLEYSHKNRPPLGKMWRQDQFRWVIVHWLRAGIYNTVCDSYFRKTVKLTE